MKDVPPTLYDTLGVTPSFPSEAIDGLRGPLGRLYECDTERMRQITAACDVLTDPLWRAQYDALLGLSGAAVKPRGPSRVAASLLTMPARGLGVLFAGLAYAVPLALAAAGAWFVYLGASLPARADAHQLAAIHGGTLSLAWAVALIVVAVGASVGALGGWILSVMLRNRPSRR